MYHFNTIKDPLTSFKIAYSVQNATKQSQTFQVWTGCYGWNWQTDNPHISIGGQHCKKNSPERVAIGAGEYFKGEINIWIDEKEFTGPLQFRLGFQPLEDNERVGVGSKKLGPFWSNIISIKGEE